MHPLPLFAFGFESFWLAFAAAPLLIHLLSRRKYRETAWAAMDLLLAAAKRRTRRIHIEQLLLLLLRTLVVVAIVTAVTEPLFTHVGPIFSPGGNTHRVLVIDSSYSMTYKATDRSRFEQAKLWAKQIVEQSRRGDGFTLVQMADPPRVVVSTPAVEAGPVRQEIENLEPLHTGADLAATLAEVRKVLDAGRRDNSRLTHKEVYIFSDLQRSTWMPATPTQGTGCPAGYPGAAAKAELRSRAAELASIARLHVIDLGGVPSGSGADNLAVTALELRQPLVLAGRGVDISATLHDFGNVPRKQQTVDLLVDDHAAGRQYVDIPAGGDAVASFHQRIETPGDHFVEVRAPGDSLEIDNHRYLAVHVREAIRVLCIDGRPAGDPQKASVYALSNALLARSNPDGVSPINVEVAPESAVSEEDLSRYDCVMLSNVAQFTSSEARVLDNYLGHGGSLVIFLGDRVRAENYNGVLADVPRPILPARLGEVATNSAHNLDPLGYRHPIVEVFRGHENVGLLTSPVKQYFKVKLLAPPATAPAPPGDTAQDVADLLRNPPQVALALGNGDPLIVTRTVRRGRVVLVTTSADTSWAMLPAWGTYLPLVRQILDWCLAGQAQPHNLSVGDTLESSPNASVSASVVVKRLDDQHHFVPLVVQDDSRAWRFDDTRISGIYAAEFGPPISQKQLFAVNLITSESDLTPISRDELRNDALPGVPLDYHTAWQAGGAPVTLSDGPVGQFHLGLLYAVVVLLLLETVFAWRLGYNTR